MKMDISPSPDNNNYRAKMAEKQGKNNGTTQASSSSSSSPTSSTSTAHLSIESLTPAGLSGGRVDFPPEPKFNKLSENLRTMTPPEMQCSVFCGGKRCRYETTKSWSPDDMALDGIYSHWITDNILAMARPSDDMVKNKGLPEKFLSAGIKSIINLQTPGEHASCGPGLQESGFTYDPNDFMAKGIFFYNYAWKDYGSRSLDCLLDMVKVIAFALGEGKVAIHCHAGLGRTGVLIACYLVYALRVRANDAIRYVRLKRANAVQTRGQILCVQEFAQYILPDVAVFCNRKITRNKKELDFTLAHFLKRQHKALHGYEARVFRYLPKIIYLICERLLQLSEPPYPSNPTSRVGSGVTARYVPHFRSEEFAVSSKPFTNFFISARVDAESSSTSSSKLGLLGRTSSLGRSITGTLSTSYSLPSLGSSAPSNLSSPSDTPTSGSPLWAKSLGGSGDDDSGSCDLSNSMLGGPLQSNQQMEPSQKINVASARDSAIAAVGKEPAQLLGQSQLDAGLSPSGEVPTCASGLSTIDDRSLDSVLGDGIRNQDLRENVVYQELSSQTDLKKMAADATAATKTLGPDEIFEALMADHDLMDETFKRSMIRYRLELNYRQTAWDRLTLEEDANLLAGLLWHWLEHLKAPVLGREELSLIVITAENPEQCLRKLDKDSKYVVEYLVRFIARMRTLTDDQTECLLRRLAAGLTQQGVAVRGILKPAGQFYGDVAGKASYTKLREGTLGRLLTFLQRFHDLVELNPLIRPPTASTMGSTLGSATSSMSSRVLPSIPGSAGNGGKLRRSAQLRQGTSLADLPAIDRRAGAVLSRHGRENGLLSDVAESPTSGGSQPSSASPSPDFVMSTDTPATQRSSRVRVDVLPPADSGLVPLGPMGPDHGRDDFGMDSPAPVGAPPGYDTVVASSGENTFELPAT